MSYIVETTRKFDKSLKKCIKRGLDIQKIKLCVSILAEKGELPVQYRPHKLSGEYSGLWECHIQPDWLLIWHQNDDKLILMLIDTGTHSDLFK